MLYIAEATLRTKAHLQLTGLSVRYIGPVAKYLMFISVAVTAIGALIAYEAAAGRIINKIFDIPEKWGSILFFIPSFRCIMAWIKSNRKRGEANHWHNVWYPCSTCYSDFF